MGIRFGLTAVKNVGKSFIANVVEERKRGGKFKDFADFAGRMADKDVNKRAVEGLIKCGAFDSLGAKRSQLLTVFESILDSEAQARKNNVAGQMSLFGDDSREESSFDLPVMNEFPKSKLLALEKESCGMYFSGHPMEEYAEKAEKLAKINIGTVLASFYDSEGNIQTVKDNDKIKLCGIVASRKNKTTKNNSQMAFVQLEDMYGSIEAIIFPKILTSYNNVLAEGNAVMLEGRVSAREDEAPKLLCESAALLDSITEPEEVSPDEAAETVKNNRVLYIKMGTLDDTVLKTAVKVMETAKGSTPVCFFTADTKKKILAPKNCWIDENSGVIDRLFGIFGENNVKFR